MHAPAGALCEGEVRVEFGEKVRVIKVKGVWPSLVKGAACQVRHLVVGSCDAPWCKGGGLGDDVAKCQSPNQALAHDGFRGSQASAP